MKYDMANRGEQNGGKMGVYVTFRNPRNNDLTQVKVGWSWTLLFFSSFFGLPLFLRKLNVWGTVLLLIWAASLIVPRMTSSAVEQAALLLIFSVIEVGLSIWLAIKGNEITAKNYLDLGWQILDPPGDIVSHAKSKWGIGRSLFL